MKRKRLGLPGTERQAERILVLQRQNDIITLLLEGKDSETIIEYISTKYKVQRSSAKDYIQKGRDEIKTRLNYELKTLVPLHIGRYETIYEKLYEMKAHTIAMGALKAKEKLMQFHKESFHLRVTQGAISQVSTIHVNNEYDHMRLDEPKRKRMEELMRIVRSSKTIKE